MNVKLRLPLLFLAVGIAIVWPCLISPQSASAQATVVMDHFRLPFTESGSLPGLGAYTVNGEYNVVSRMTITPDGKYNATFHQNLIYFDGWLIDLGIPFRGTNSINAHETSAPNTGPPPYEYTFTQAWTAITPGSAINLVGHVTLHVTINANGELTAEVINVWFEVRGGGKTP